MAAINESGTDPEIAYRKRIVAPASWRSYRIRDFDPERIVEQTLMGNDDISSIASKCLGLDEHDVTEACSMDKSHLPRAKSSDRTR